MALKKTMVRQNGVTVTYHKIGEIRLKKCEAELDEEEKQKPVKYSVNCNVHSYTNEEYRQKGTENYVENDFFSCDLSEAEMANVYSSIYGKLKESEKFSGAEDV